MAAHITILILALACYASFMWGAARFLVRPGGRQTEMERISIATGLTIVADVTGLTFGFALVPWRAAAGGLLFAAALGLFWWAVWTNRTRPLSFAFSEDRPVQLITAGPYSYMRHPLYVSYFGAWIAAPLAGAPWPLLLPAAGMLWFYARAANHEEAKFAASPLADAYAAYKARTPALLPLPRRAA